MQINLFGSNHTDKLFLVYSEILVGRRSLSVYKWSDASHTEGKA